MHPRFRFPMAGLPWRGQRYGRARGPDRPPLARGVPPFVLRLKPPRTLTSCWPSSSPFPPSLFDRKVVSSTRLPEAVLRLPETCDRPPQQWYTRGRGHCLLLVSPVTVHVVHARCRTDLVRLVCSVQHRTHCNAPIFLWHSHTTIAPARSALMVACRYFLCPCCTTFVVTPISRLQASRPITH